ncbi:MAG: hypothetical protein HOE90_04855 [Bacteriovoracaceae bacterium]|nr:hypothetical protein [Bacteriovoracaceae bacterium]
MRISKIWDTYVDEITCFNTLDLVFEGNRYDPSINFKNEQVLRDFEQVDILKQILHETSVPCTF